MARVGIRNPDIFQKSIADFSVEPCSSRETIVYVFLSLAVCLALVGSNFLMGRGCGCGYGVQPRESVLGKADHFPGLAIRPHKEKHLVGFRSGPLRGQKAGSYRGPVAVRQGRIGRAIFKNMYIYTGSSHPHEAQKPKKIEL